MILYDVIKPQDDLHNQYYGTLSTFLLDFVSIVSTTELLPLPMISDILDLYYKICSLFLFLIYITAF